MPLHPNGLHHIALMTADIKAQIAYFSDVLGARLVALYWMHGAKGTWHGFLELGPTCSVAFVQAPGVGDIPATLGVTHAATPAQPCAAGTLQHLALNVDGDAQLLALRDRIRSRGIACFGPVDHGLCKSIYFAGLEGLLLELSTSRTAIDPAQWIDPEVVALAGISAQELQRYTAPAEFAAPLGSVPQPAHDPGQPHMSYPPERYRRMLAMTDAAFAAASDDTEPPVPPTAPTPAAP